MKPLTARQLAIFQFICETTFQVGFPPTVREIGERFGLRSNNGVAGHLAALERKGVLQRLPRSFRPWAPVPPEAV